MWEQISAGGREYTSKAMWLIVKGVPLLSLTTLKEPPVVFMRWPRHCVLTKALCLLFVVEVDDSVSEVPLQELLPQHCSVAVDHRERNQNVGLDNGYSTACVIDRLAVGSGIDVRVRGNLINVESPPDRIGGVSVQLDPVKLDRPQRLGVCLDRAHVTVLHKMEAIVKCIEAVVGAFFI